MPQDETVKSNKSIVFFDGFCNLCNASIDWLILRDHQKMLFFSPLQGETARAKLPPQEIQNLSSVVVLKSDGQVLHRSLAVFYLLRQVHTGLKILLIFSILPTFMTDLAYGLIARYRLLFFGRRQTCRLPTDAEKLSFLP